MVATFDYFRVFTIFIVDLTPDIKNFVCKPHVGDFVVIIFFFGVLWVGIWVVLSFEF